jgi:type IV pilus assembly protein PilV
MTTLKKNSPKKNPLKHQAGLMLIEVLISILIFSIGILGMVGLQTIATQNAANSEFRTIASTLANDIVSQMWIKKTANPSDANLSGDITIWKAKVSASTLPNASGTVTLTNSITTVTVTWKPPSKKSTENTNQYVTQVSIPN